MKKIHIIGIGVLVSVILIVGMANAEFLGNFMRSPEERLQHATDAVAEQEKDLVLAMKEKMRALKDVAVYKGEKEQEKPFEKQDQIEITRLSNVIKETKSKTEKLNAGQYCFTAEQ